MRPARSGCSRCARGSRTPPGTCGAGEKFGRVDRAQPITGAPNAECGDEPGEKLTPQLISTLTEPFRRGTERIRTDHAGVGLGLAIVKSIAQAHDGTLTLTSRAGGGLRVTVQLPAASPHTGARQHP